MASLSNIVTAALALSAPALGSVIQNVRRGESLIPSRSSGDNFIRASDNIETMKPLRPTPVSAKSKDSRRAAFDLKDQNSLFWGSLDGTVAELVVKVPGEAEAIVDAEYFDTLIDSMECHETGSGQIKLAFSDAADFEAASEVWKWVSQVDNEFLFVVGSGSCGWNEERIIFRVQDLDLDSEANTAMLQADAVTWKEALHSYDLVIGKAAAGSEAAQRLSTSDNETRAADFTVPFDADVSGQSVSFTLEGVTFTGTCAQCTVSGLFEVDARFSVDWFDLEEAAVDVTTPGINVVAILEANIAGQTAAIFPPQSFTLFEFQPAGFSIPGIAEIGPTVTVVLMAGVTSVSGTVTLTLGGTATIGPSSATLDFLSSEGTTATGWVPVFETVPLQSSALIEVSAAAALKPSLRLEVSAFGKYTSPYS